MADEPRPPYTLGEACAWCGDRPAYPYMLEKPRHTVAPNGTRVVKRSALQVMVCSVHLRQFESSEDNRAGR